MNLWYAWAVVVTPYGRHLSELRGSPFSKFALGEWATMIDDEAEFTGDVPYYVYNVIWERRVKA